MSRCAWCSSLRREGKGGQTLHPASHNPSLRRRLLAQTHHSMLKDASQAFVWADIHTSFVGSPSVQDRKEVMGPDAEGGDNANSGQEQKQEQGKGSREGCAYPPTRQLVDAESRRATTWQAIACTWNVNRDCVC